MGGARAAVSGGAGVRRSQQERTPFEAYVTLTHTNGQTMPAPTPFVSGRSARKLLDQTRTAALSHAQTLRHLETHVVDVLDPARLATAAILTRGFWGRLKWLVSGR